MLLKEQFSITVVFSQTLVKFLANAINHPLLIELYQLRPRTMVKARKLVGWSTNNGVILFTVCPKCSALYKLSDCILWECDREESKRCSHIDFPNHPHPLRRVKCNTTLL